MKSIIFSIFFIFILASYNPGTKAQSVNPSGRVDSLFADWNKPGKPGAAIGVVYQGKLIYARGFGEADLETGASIKPETIFHVASVSKQFTAYAIVLLAKQGKMALDDDIRKYLPEVPDFGKPITIRQLIYHTSGLRDQWNLVAMAGGQLDDVITKEHIFNLIKRQKELNFEPGSTFSYSNTGYTLLAELVSRITRQPFPNWMQQHVFKPLGMKNTLFYDDHERIVKGRAYSFYQPSGPTDRTFSKSVLSYANVGATSLFTTVTDLARWVSHFRSSTNGNKTIMAQMLERGRLANRDTLPYAFGLSVDNYKGLGYYGHGGADAGFRSFLCYFPQQDYGFIVLSNQAEFDPGKKAMEVARIYLAGQLKEQKPDQTSPNTTSFTTYKIDPTIFKHYAGAYELTAKPGFVLTFRRDGTRYLMQATGQDEFEIFPSSDTTFFLTVVAASVIFHRPKQGSTTHITYKQNGDYPGIRVQPSADRVASLQELVGTYYSPELETIYTISQKADTLRLSHIRHGEVVLKGIARDRLEAPWWFIQTIDMVRDSSKRIIGLRMSTGRVKHLWFKRVDSAFNAELWPMGTK